MNFQLLDSGQLKCTLIFLTAVSESYVCRAWI